MLIPDYEHQDNLKRKAYFEGLGYSFNINGDGYSVKFKDHFVCGAGVQLPRQSKTRRTFKHIQADMQEYLRSAVNAARNHRDALLINNPDILEENKP